MHGEKCGEKTAAKFVAHSATKSRGYVTWRVMDLTRHPDSTLISPRAHDPVKAMEFVAHSATKSRADKIPFSIKLSNTLLIQTVLPSIRFSEEPDTCYSREFVAESATNSGTI